MAIPEFLQQKVFGNEIIEYLIALLILGVGLGLNRLLSRLTNMLLFRLTKRYTAGVTEQELHDLLIKPVARLLLVITIYLAFSVLRYPLPPTAVMGVGGSG
ncbi:MAG: hypothetical protein EOO56_18015, partial [Hymenobacter sp.]